MGSSCIRYHRTHFGNLQFGLRQSKGRRSFHVTSSGDGKSCCISPFSRKDAKAQRREAVGGFLLESLRLGGLDGRSCCINPFLWVLRASSFWVCAAMRSSRLVRHDAMRCCSGLQSMGLESYRASPCSTSAEPFLLRIHRA